MKPIPFDPALSFSNPKHDLRGLFDAVAIGDGRPVTVVCGAGVSIAAGLPSWKGLIENHVEALDERLRENVLRDPIDLPRKASLIRALAPEHRSTEDILRDALYGGGPAAPSPFAQSVARLIVQRAPSIRLATTNFDDQLERALQAETVSADPRSIEEPSFKEWAGGAGGVLHLHGFVPYRPNDRVQTPGPLVLTEADFYRHGAKVRACVVEILTTSHVVFVGMSMTDPNIVGSLLDESLRTRLEGLDLRRFLIVPPDILPPSLSESRNYFRDDYQEERRNYLMYGQERSEKLAKELSVEPIFLNSYSQNSQLFIELSIAQARPGEYMSEESTLRYGRRLTEYLRGATSKMGLEQPAEDIFVSQGTMAMALRERLGPLRDLIRQLMRSDKALRAVDRLVADFETERLGLLLWMRSPQGQDGISEYMLTLLACSAYAHFEGWSGMATAAVLSDSPYPVAQTLFDGRYRKDSIAIEGAQQTWRSQFCAPVALKLGGDDAHTTVAGISLQSKRPLGDHPFCPPNEPRSFLAAFGPDHDEQLQSWLVELAEDVLPEWSDVRQGSGV